MLRTRMVSDRPGIPGRTPQMPRTHRSTGTPAIEARYSASMIASSMMALHLNWILAGSPRGRRHQQPPVGALPGVPGEVVEQVAGVLPHGPLGGQQAEVLIQPGGGRVVVAGPDMAVAA